MTAPALILVPPSPRPISIARSPEKRRESGNSKETTRSNSTSSDITSVTDIYSMYGYSTDTERWNLESANGQPILDQGRSHAEPRPLSGWRPQSEFRTPRGDSVLMPTLRPKVGRSPTRPTVSMHSYLPVASDADNRNLHQPSRLEHYRHSQQLSELTVLQPPLSNLQTSYSNRKPQPFHERRADTATPPPASETLEPQPQIIIESPNNVQQPPNDPESQPVKASPLSESLPSPPRTPGRPPSVASLHPSATSIHPSTSVHPSEDGDSFHVRSTYAQLDVSGVRGDGWEEGIELTRARMGAQDQVIPQPQKTADVSDAERQILASLDRYGFYHTPSHDRLILLPSISLSKILVYPASTSTFPPTPSHLPFLPPIDPTPQQRRTEHRRIGKWQNMLVARREQGGNGQIWTVKPSKVRKWAARIYKGIPDRWRSAGWWTLIEQFSTACQSADSLATQYRDLIDKPSQFDIQIDLDVPRTISGHVLFRTRYGHGQRSLFHVLHAFSLLCPDCGYVQGMGPIAATLLCYFDAEKTYVAMVRLHDSYHMHSIFSPGFPGMLEAIYVQERIIERMLPGIYENFKKHMITTTSYATKWYITLFANSVPFQTQLRLWDVLLLEGMDVIVLVAVAIIWSLRDHLISPNATFETILSLLSSFFVAEDEDILLQWLRHALDDRRLRANMAQWRADWKELVRKGEDGKALL